METTGFIDRMIRAAMLDVKVYEEVEADESATAEAAGVVVLAAVAAAIGSRDAGVTGTLIAGVMSLVGWGIWAFLTYWIGTRLLAEPQTKASYGELLRTIAFSSSPGILRVAGIVPALQTISFLIAGVWMLVAMVVAVRQALDYQSTARAVVVCIIGWFVQLVIVSVTLAYIASRPDGT